MPVLVLIRHGQSVSVADRKFSGWEDTQLTKYGTQQSYRAGKILVQSHITFDAIYTSYLKRAHETATQIASALNWESPVIKTDWRLNERHYGALQGQLRAEATKTYGTESIKIWRRNFRGRPPKLSVEHPSHPRNSEKYKDVAPDLLPSTESMRDAALRANRWWMEVGAPKIEQGTNLLIVAHTASVRGITKTIENLSDDEAGSFRVPTAIPIMYRLSKDSEILQKTVLGRSLSERVHRALQRLCIELTPRK